jgi:serine/threonine-protein phosphatase 6 regulatory ankyrin repeat subunit B
MQTTIYWNSVDAMTELIRSGLKPIDADVHYATMHNRPRGLSFLIEQRANVECEINGTLPIHVSARHGLVDCMNLLVDGGARWNASDNLGCTPMHWSAIRKNPAAMNALLARGAYVNVEEGGNFLPTVRQPTPDWSPIHVSVEGRGFEVVGILLSNKAKQIPMWDGRWPLHIAVQNARVDLVPVLVRHGANLAVKNLKGQTPIDLAKSMERDDITEILAKGSD